MTRIYDISEPLDERSAPFPGDTPFSRDWVLRMEDGGSCNVSWVRMSAHLGTHADAPLHYDREGAAIDEVPLERYIGACRVVAPATRTEPVPDGGERSFVDPASLVAAGIEPGAGIERVLLRTVADGAHDRTRFRDDFTALGTEAAAHLVRCGVLLVGIDTPSMDHASAKVLSAHDVLCHGDVSLLENLDLTGVPEGDYELIALPLRIVGSDSSPVRAILRG